MQMLLIIQFTITHMCTQVTDADLVMVINGEQSCRISWDESMLIIQTIIVCFWTLP